MLEGQTIYSADNGTFLVNDMRFTSDPNSEHRIVFTTNGIDSSKKSNKDYLNAQGGTSINFELNLFLRSCILGEYFSDNGK